jgi:xanthine/uracil permease
MGDDYSITSSLLVNGLATMISALFGNPFPTTLFIGAPIATFR